MLSFGSLGGILSAPFHWVGGLVGGLAGSAAGSILALIAKQVMQALNQVIETVGTLWVAVGTPNLTTTTAGSTPSSTVAYIQGHLWWYTTAGAIVGVLVGCGRMAWEQRADAGKDILRGLVTFLAVSGAGLTVLALMVSAADAFSTWIISDSVQGSFGASVTGLLALGAGTGGFTAILVIVLGLFALLASLIQIVLMVIRGGMLVLLAGVLPTTAAFTNTQAGREWFRKSVAWIVAFVLYKPVAAVIYATAFRLSSQNVFGTGGVLSIVTGITLMFIALLALPALMRFVTPLVGATAGGGAGAMLGVAAAGAAVALPSGAVAQGLAAGVSGLAGSGGGGGGPGGSVIAPQSDRGPAGGGGSDPGARNGSSAPASAGAQT